MVTKEQETNKKCCLYVSDFHLEMILLPYIKNRIENSDFVIMTQKDLSETIKVLLDRVNMSNLEKQQIISLDWKNNDEVKIRYINKKLKENKELNIIINGKYDYVQKINETIKSIKSKNIHIIDCFCIEDKQVKKEEIKKNYKEFINTTRI